MSTTPYFSHPYTCTMWYPYNVALEAATYSVKIKAPEIGNTIEQGRNQAFVRNRLGSTIVHDLGAVLDDRHTLSFVDMPDTERSALVTFLSLIKWGASAIAYKDYKGDVRYIRIASKTLQYADNGYITKRTDQETLWSFRLDIADISYNASQVDPAESTVPSVLTIHLADTNDPHNAESTVTINIADGAKLVEEFLVDSFRAHIWSGTAEKDNRCRVFQVMGEHNGYSTNDATLADKTEVYGAELGTALGMTFTIVLTGTGTTQKVQLKCAVTQDTTVLRFKRAKLGKLS